MQAAFCTMRGEVVGFLWLKMFHIFFMVAWFAGLFYLPRIYVNLAMAQNDAEYARLVLMAQKLYRFMQPWCVGTLVCGLAMPLFYLPFAGWVHGKIAIGALLLGYHIWCGRLLRQFVMRQNVHSHRWYRVFNELPVLALLCAIYLALFKPF